MNIYYIYILTSIRDGNLYIGMTNDLQRRLYEHNLAYKGSTRTRAPFKIVYYEKFYKRMDARKREKFLKSGYGREWIKQILNNIPG